MAVVRVGVLPDQSPAVLGARYEPLLRYLSDTVGVPLTYVPSASYDELLEQIAHGAVDLAWLGGVTFVQASQDGQMAPLVLRARDTRFTSYLLVREGDPAQTLQDLKGRRMAFGARLSTSGHYMPRHFLAEQGIDPETFFGQITHTGTHDATALTVLNGTADAGAVNAAIIDRMLADARIPAGRLRVLWETPPYVDYVWAVRTGLPEALVQRLRDAFLALDDANPDHHKILEPLSARVFLPARREDFAALRGILASGPQSAAASGKGTRG